MAEYVCDDEVYDHTYSLHSLNDTIFGLNISSERWISSRWGTGGMTMADNGVYAGGLLNPIGMHLIFLKGYRTVCQNSLNKEEWF